MKEQNILHVGDRAIISNDAFSNRNVLCKLNNAEVEIMEIWVDASSKVATRPVDPKIIHWLNLLSYKTTPIYIPRNKLKKININIIDF